MEGNGDGIYLEGSGYVLRRFIVGAGDAFRMVAQALMGAGGGAANYALERDAERRKNENLFKLLQTKEQKTPLEIEKLKADIAATNRSNRERYTETSSMAIDRRIEETIKQQEIAQGVMFTPRQRATVKSRLLQRVLLRPSNEERFDTPGLSDPFSGLPDENPVAPTVTPDPKPLSLRERIFGGSLSTAQPELGEHEILGLVNLGKITPEEGRARINKLRQK